MTVERAHELVQQVLPEFGVGPDATVTLIKQRENTVFRVTDGDTDLAVRLHRRGYHSDEDIAGEAAMVTLLADAAVPVPEYVTTLDGRVLALVEDADGQGPHQIDAQVWIDGAAPVGDGGDSFAGTAPVDLETWRGMGAMAAESHNAMEAAHGAGAVPAAGGRAAWDTSGLAGPDFAWGDPRRLDESDAEERDLLTRALAALNAELCAVPRDVAHFGPIHADLTVENVMRGPNGLVLIDFDDFAEGFYLFDVATMLFFSGPHPRYKDIERAVLEGYTSVRPLQQEELDRLPGFILGRAMTYLGWAADRRGEPEAEFIAADVRPHVVGLARDYLANH
jgi:Ser/Thr protein kinase RdoA (MazF antagonist)